MIENSGSDIAWGTALTFAPQPDIIRLGPDTLDRKAITERGHVFLDILSDFEQPVSLGDVTPTASGRYVTAALSPNEKSYVYLLIDLHEQSYITLGEYHFRRFKDDLTSSRAVSFTARDGLRVPAIISLPEGTTGSIPFVVRVHGGPTDNFYLEYDHEVQFLNNRGYGVLSVNFRGSTGFGRHFQAEGFRQFGRAMQNDVSDAAQWLIDQKLADPDAIAVMGSSYGGYAAALAMTRDPGLFKAAVVEFPILDLVYQTKNYPGFWEKELHNWWRYFGNPENDTDLELMKEYSPSERISDIHGPILLLAGEVDPIVDVRQVNEFLKKAEKAEKPVTSYIFSDAGHGVETWRDSLRRARLIEDFLAGQLGGRSGGFELVEMAPGFIQ